MRQTFVLLSTLFHVPSRKTTRRFCCCSTPAKFGWPPLFSEGRTQIQAMATMARATPIVCAVRSSSRRNFFMAWLPATWRRPAHERIGDLAENKPFADSAHVARSGYAASTWAGFLLTNLPLATDAPQQTASLFDQLVRNLLKMQRHVEAL